MLKLCPTVVYELLPSHAAVTSLTAQAKFCYVIARPDSIGSHGSHLLVWEVTVQSTRRLKYRARFVILRKTKTQHP